VQVPIISRGTSVYRWKSSIRNRASYSTPWVSNVTAPPWNQVFARHFRGQHPGRAYRIETAARSPIAGQETSVRRRCSFLLSLLYAFREFVTSVSSDDQIHLRSTSQGLVSELTDRPPTQNHFRLCAATRHSAEGKAICKPFGRTLGPHSIMGQRREYRLQDDQRALGDGC
jgi:hypothetical protein